MENIDFNMSYIEAFVEQFNKQIRVYLDNGEDSFSFISWNLIQALHVDLVEEDKNGPFVILDLIYKNIHLEEDLITVRFDVLDTSGFEFVMANDVLKDFDYYEDCIIFPNGSTKIYHSSRWMKQENIQQLSVTTFNPAAKYLIL